MAKKTVFQTEGRIIVNAHAKINLSLDILGTLPNGYHKVQMIMQSLFLHDTVTISVKEPDSVEDSDRDERTSAGQIRLICNDSSLPTDNKNLAYRAARLFLNEHPQKENIRITLDKEIPVAAGLAGGSSDAAAVLRGLNLLFSTDLSEAELASLGLTLGADVPYCLMLGTALSEGIGERLTPLPKAPKCTCLLVKPAASVSTGEIYKQYDILAQSAAVRHPDTEALLEAIKTGSFRRLTQNMCNVLEPVTTSFVPEIAEIRKKMYELGAEGVLMSGSGPTVFGLFSNDHAAHEADRYFYEHNYEDTFLTSFYCP